MNGLDPTEPSWGLRASTWLKPRTVSANLHEARMACQVADVLTDWLTNA